MIFNLVIFYFSHFLCFRTIALIALFSQYLTNVKIPVPAYSKERGGLHFGRFPLFRLFPVSIIRCPMHDVSISRYSLVFYAPPPPPTGASSYLGTWSLHHRDVRSRCFGSDLSRRPPLRAPDQSLSGNVTRGLLQGVRKVCPFLWIAPLYCSVLGSLADLDGFNSWYKY